jgi:transposase
MIAMDPRALPDDVEALKKLLVEEIAQRNDEIARRDEELARRDERIRILESENRLLRAEHFGRKSERRPVDPDQLSGPQGTFAGFIASLIEQAERVADEKGVGGTVELRSPRTRTKPKRRQDFPDHLPRVRSTFRLEEKDRACACGGTLDPIGEEVTRELERVEVAVVHEIARTKYACKSCQCGVTIAAGPERVIDKGLLGVGFLANVLVERFAHHMPYNRLESKYAGEGFALSRSVLCESVGRCAELLEPIAEQIKKDALASGVVQTDDTPVTIQEDSKNKSREGRVWVYRGLGGQVFFDVTETRGRDGPRAVLAGYAGILQADAYAGYDAFFKDGTILEVACWAHARRYFVKAEGTNAALAKEALDRIGELYAIESGAKSAGLDAAAVHELRQRESLPRLEALFGWMEDACGRVLPQSPLYKAIEYALNNRVALTRYTSDGRVDIDNNGAERALRTVAVGRKNWIFFGNERGGQTAAVMYSLIATCKEHGVNPLEYLRDVLLRIGKVSDVRELTPYGWKEKWAPVVAAHRASVLERLMSPTKG